MGIMGDDSSIPHAVPAPALCWVAIRPSTDAEVIAGSTDRPCSKLLGAQGAWPCYRGHTVWWQVLWMMMLL